MPLARASEPQHSSTGRPHGCRRGDYVSQACLNCRKRKIKCSGGIKCTECDKNDEHCVYGERRRQQRVHKRHHIESQRPFDVQAIEIEDRDALIDMNSRLSSLEDQCARLRTTLGSSCNSNHQPNTLSRIPSPRHMKSVTRLPEQQDPSVLVETSHLDAVVSETALPQNTHENTYQDVAIVNSGTDLDHVESLSSVNQLHQQSDQTTNIDYHLLPAPPQFDSAASDTRAIVQDIRQNNGAAYRRTFDLFFRYLNPLHPLINENEFLFDFETLVFHDSDATLTSEQAVVLALVCLVRAEVAILDHISADSSHVPGWKDFCTAQAILQDLLWKGENNIKTLQCLCLKTRYLMCLDQLHLAYDTVASAVRICLLINLNDETRWENTDTFGSVMRARLFWCLYTLDHAVALNCGLPSHTAKIEYNVRLPDFLDDRSLFPGRPLPGPTIGLSSLPYLHKLVAWAKICMSMEDRLHSLSAPRLLSEDDVIQLDNRILDTLVDVQNGADGGSTIMNSFRHYSRENLMLSYRVRMNSLRLLIRQDYMSTLSAEPVSVQSIIDIISESVYIIKSFIWIRAENTGRYAATAGYSHLLTPLSYLIFRVENGSDLWNRALNLWHEALDGLKQISFGFVLARRTLNKFKTLIDITENISRDRSHHLGPGSDPNLAAANNYEVTRSLREHLLPQEYSSSRPTILQGNDEMHDLTSQYHMTGSDFGTVQTLQIFTFSAFDIPKVVSW